MERLSRRLFLSVLSCVAAAPGFSMDGDQSAAVGPSFEAVRASAVDRTWVTPIGVAGHHRTLGVTYSGSLGDLPLSQFQSFYPLPLSKRPWVSDVPGVFHDAVGLSIGEPHSFWGTTTLRHRLLDGRLPVVISDNPEGDLRIEQTAFATLPGGEALCRLGNEPLLAYVRVAVTNRAGSPREAVIWVWKSGPSPTYGEIGGLTRKFEPVRLAGPSVVGESGNHHLLFLPASWTLSFDQTADTKDLRYFGRLFRKLAPGETAAFDFVYPYWALNESDARHVARHRFDETLAKVAASWEALLSKGMRVSVPDEKIGQAFDTGLVNTLLLTRRVPSGLIAFDAASFFTRETQPIPMHGTIRLGHYNLMYDDTAQKAIVHTFLETGHPEYARELLETIFHAQGLAQPQGAFSQQGCLSAGNVTAVGERGCSSVWMSGTGYSLWAAAEYYRYTRAVAWIRKHRDGLISALQWIKNERRRPDHDKGYEGLLRGRGICDAKHATYHPFNDIVTWWGMKEIVRVLLSLGLAGPSWENEVRDYERTIKRVYEADDLRAFRGFGGADYGLTAGAAIMSGLYSLASEVGKRIVDSSANSGWYGMYLGRFMIEQGQADRFLASYFGLVANHMSHGTHCNGEWPIRTSPEDQKRSVINVQPHGHSNAGFHFMTRAMLVYEERAFLHLLRGVPGWWLTQSERPIQVQQAPTAGGPVSFTVRRVADRIEAHMDLAPATRRKTIALHLPVPRGTSLGEVEVNGKPSPPRSTRDNVVSLSGLSGVVHVVVRLK